MRAEPLKADTGRPAVPFPGVHDLVAGDLRRGGRYIREGTAERRLKPCSILKCNFAATPKAYQVRQSREFGDGTGEISDFRNGIAELAALVIGLRNYAPVQGRGDWPSCGNEPF